MPHIICVMLQTNVNMNWKIISRIFMKPWLWSVKTWTIEREWDKKYDSSPLPIFCSLEIRGPIRCVSLLPGQQFSTSTFGMSSLINSRIFRKNHCTPFKHDIRCGSLCGVEFVVTKERREKRAQRESCLKGVRSL